MEQITTSAVSRVALPLLFFKAPRAGAILLAPLRAMRSISAVLISNFHGSSSSVKKRKFLPNVFSLQRAIEQVFRVNGGRVRSGCADPFPTTSRAQAGGPDNPAAFPPRGSASRQMAIKRCWSVLICLSAGSPMPAFPFRMRPIGFPLVKTAGACVRGAGHHREKGDPRCTSGKGRKIYIASRYLR